MQVVWWSTAPGLPRLSSDAVATVLYERMSASCLQQSLSASFLGSLRSPSGIPSLDGSFSRLQAFVLLATSMISRRCSFCCRRRPLALGRLLRSRRPSMVAEPAGRRCAVYSHFARLCDLRLFARSSWLACRLGVCGVVQCGGHRARSLRWLPAIAAVTS